MAKYIGLLTLMREIEIAVRHNGCPVSETSGQYPEVELRNVSKSQVGEEFSKRLLGLSGPKENIQAFADAFRDCAKVQSFDRVSDLEISPVFYSATIRYHNGPSIAKLVMENGCYQRNTVVVKRGIEHWIVYSENESEIKELTKDIESYGNDIVAYRSVDVGTISSNKLHGYETLFAQLTDSQQQAFETALQCGFYEHESEVTVEDVADRLGRHYTTVWEHLDKVEETILHEVGHRIFGGSEQHNNVHESESPSQS